MSSPAATASYISYIAHYSEVDGLHRGSSAVYPSPQTLIHQHNRKTIFFVHVCVAACLSACDRSIHPTSDILLEDNCGRLQLPGLRIAAYSHVAKIGKILAS